MRISRLRFGLALGGIAILAAACNSDSDGGNGFGGGISTLGSDFVTAFRADPNSEPVNAQDVKLKLTPFIEPFDPN